MSGAILAAVRLRALFAGAVAGIALFHPDPVLAQPKSACGLLSKADAEALLGTTYIQAKPYGKNGSGCEYQVAAGATTAEQLKVFTLEVMYWDAPNPQAVESARKAAFEEMQQKPVDLPGVADAALWSSAGNTGSLYVFRGGTVRIHVGPSAIGLDKSRAVALKALAAVDVGANVSGPGSKAADQVARGKTSASGSQPSRRTADMPSATTITVPKSKPDTGSKSASPVDTTWLDDADLKEPAFARALYTGDFGPLAASRLRALSYVEKLNTTFAGACPGVFSADVSTKAQLMITAASLQLLARGGSNAIGAAASMADASEAGRSDAFDIGAAIGEQDPFQPIDLTKICREEDAARFAANIKRFVESQK